MFAISGHTNHSRSRSVKIGAKSNRPSGRAVSIAQNAFRSKPKDRLRMLLWITLVGGQWQTSMMSRLLSSAEATEADRDGTLTRISCSVDAGVACTPWTKDEKRTLRSLPPIRRSLSYMRRANFLPFRDRVCDSIS